MHQGSIYQIAYVKLHRKVPELLFIEKRESHFLSGKLVPECSVSHSVIIGRSPKGVYRIFTIKYFIKARGPFSTFRTSGVASLSCIRLSFFLQIFHHCGYKTIQDYDSIMSIYHSAPCTATKYNHKS